MTAPRNLFCPLCGNPAGPHFTPGPGGRPDAGCPSCGSLERHRFLAVLLGCLRPGLGPVDALLDVAPSTQVTPLLDTLGARHRLRLDLGADNRLVDVLGSLTDLPLPDSSIDFIICYHVLEHIPDDRRAMAELARVLRPGGTALLQVPWNPGHPTDEDPSASVPERLARFGQADHVRFYGDDFEDRLNSAGLDLQRVTPRSLIGESICSLLKISPDEMMWLATPSVGPGRTRVVSQAPTGLNLALDFVAGELVTQQEQLQETRAQLARARRRVAVLERRLAPVSKIARALPGPVRARLRRL